MARLVGIDIRPSHVRVAVVQTQYRGTQLLALREAPIQSSEQVAEALQVVVLPLLLPGDHVGVIVPGDRLFLRDIDLPVAAVKQLGDVVPYEIEARVPVDFEDLVFDYRLLERKAGQESLKVLAAAARVEDVRRQIQIVQSAVGAEPERVAAGPVVLCNLSRIVPEIAEEGPIALLDVGLGSSDLVVLEGGLPVFARTLSVGAEAGGQAMVAALRQSQAAWLSRGLGPFTRLFLTGAGPVVEGASPVLSQSLGIAVSPLPPTRLLGVEQLQVGVAGFEKALAAALGMSSGARDLNLRRGPLEYHHSYEFIKTKLPLMAALAALIVASFAFSVWARARALASENASLEVALSTISERAFGERMEDADAIIERLDRGGSGMEKDPQAKLDALAILVEVSKAIDEAIVHDMDEFEVQGEKVKMVGIVSSIEEVEKIEAAIKKVECFQEIQRGTINQVVNSKRQKYSLTFTASCEEDDKKKLAKAEKGARQ